MSLCVTVKLNERVKVIASNGEVIWVGLADVQHRRARIDFTAPKSVTIIREALIDQNSSTTDDASST